MQPLLLYICVAFISSSTVLGAPTEVSFALELPKKASPLFKEEYFDIAIQKSRGKAYYLDSKQKDDLQKIADTLDELLARKVRPMLGLNVNDKTKGHELSDLFDEAIDRGQINDQQVKHIM